MNEVIDKLEEYQRKDPGYASTLFTALIVIGADELANKLGEAEQQGKRLELTYPIPFDVGPSEPNGVTLV